MLRKRPLLRALLIFLLSITGLLAIYPVVRTGYLGFLVNAGNEYFSNPGKDAFVRFMVNKESKDLDLRMNVGNIRQIRSDPKAIMLVTKASSFYIAWIYFILLTALILASPVSAVKKLILFITGFIYVHVLVFLKLMIQVCYVCNQHPELDILRFSPSGVKFLETLLDQFVDTVQPTLILVIIFWIITTFSIRDIRKLRESLNSPK